MTIHVALSHETMYHYERPIALGPQIIRLRPAPHSRTPILSYSLKIEPEDHFLNWQQDPHSNYLARLVVPEKTDLFHVKVDLVAEMSVINPFDYFLEKDATSYPFTYDEIIKKDLAPYLETLPTGPFFKKFLKTIDRSPRETNDFLVSVNRTVQEAVAYTIRMEPGVQTCEETLTLKSGSCRDSAWLLVQVLRHLGLAARFVSGYLIQLTPDVKSLDGPSGTDVDFTDLHAWTEVYLPGAGWIGLDPTSGLLTGEGHIPLAATPEPRTAAPVDGLVEPCEVTFDHQMSIQRILETPRVTKPYSDSQWSDINRLGQHVDQVLERNDVRLTMGGEPTFVSIDDMEGAEWNNAAVGPMKRGRAEDLIRRLQDRFAPQGLLHYGQGKWYPGESLPRWAFALFWRGDGKPLWRHPELIAHETTDYHPTIDQAETFLRSMAVRLDVSPENAQALYEDPLHFLAKEQNLPENVDPLDAKLDDAEERSRLARVFERGLKNAAGFVLPIQRWQSRGQSQEQSRDSYRWISQKWDTRRGRLFLMPGDSAVGLRLPLESLYFLEKAAYPHLQPQDPFSNRRPLPNIDDRRQPYQKGGQQAVQQRYQAQPNWDANSHGWTVRTAMTVEPRDGRLCVFMPPVESVEDYIDLLDAIEDTALELSIPVHIEGYLPPSDDRLNVIKVTPDPGVIEVNVHPAKDWESLREITTALYEEAYFSRLAAEKFMVDGRHTGTGGGNHIVVGGNTPADSPFLRRPDMLKSLIAYWQNHPSLSYLFSGQFIGPTSQAPRIDEARNDSLYEMEIAFQQVPDPLKTSPDACPPWLVDRIFRNLLIDSTGNTHRAEICIDKLYSPDGPTGRLGLVEFRGFEMPPHPQMSLAQQLLLRTLMARFWESPYERKLIRWGTELHDRFMLPHYVWADFQEVLEDLQDHGFDFKEDWFAPHQEFRFPRHGSLQYKDISLEIRHALEPWHVMGEEGVVGGTARYVDSSLERLQVKVTGLSGDRFAVLCQGRTLPLHATAVRTEFVAGVRYRAWQPPTSLHPTIGVHSPLVFDLVDTWNNRAVAGCTYHVAHPGGRSHETFPVNAYEAESRRSARFTPHGHSSGTIFAHPVTRNPDAPYTLDLRRF